MDGVSPDDLDVSRTTHAALYCYNDRTSPPCSEVELWYQATLADIFGKVTSTSTYDCSESVAQKNSQPEVEVPFRLFSTGLPQIIFEEEDKTVNLAGSGFVVRQRPQGERHYFASSAKGLKKQQFDLAALSGQEVCRRRNTRAWGLEVPWRVKIINVSGGHIDKAAHEMIHKREYLRDTTKQKRKPGKKRRILLRERARKSAAAQEALQIQERDATIAERLKKTQRNREKKAKKKLKEKAKKVASSPASIDYAAMSTCSTVDAG